MKENQYLDEAGNARGKKTGFRMTEEWKGRTETGSKACETAEKISKGEKGWRKLKRLTGAIREKERIYKKLEDKKWTQSWSRAKAERKSKWRQSI